MNLCDTCKKEESVGVACIPGMPLSVAYCKTCLQNDAHPTWALLANVDCIGSVEDIAPWFLELKTIMDGNYVTLKEYLEKTKYQPQDIYSDVEYPKEINL